MTKPLFLYIPVLLAGLLLCVSLRAGPARPGLLLFTQPDGSTFQGRLTGDEFMSVLTDASGHALVQDTDGWYCYAAYNADGSKSCSGVHVGENASSDVLAASLSIPYGTLNNLGNSKRRRRGEIMAEKKMMVATKSEGSVDRAAVILLVQFSDYSMTYTRDDFEAMINSSGYSLYGASGSAKDYFEDQVHGAYDFTFEVTPIVTVSGTQAYYGAHSSTDVDKYPQGIVAEACQLAYEQGLDFSRFDTDGDGEVDHVFVFVAGKDEAEGGGDDCIWSHMWYLYDGAGIKLELNGVLINNYAMSTEYCLFDNGRFQFRTIGTFCHEYGHGLGLMDLYDTDYTSSGGECDPLWGTLDIMDAGNYNNSGNTPPNYSAIELDDLGIGVCETLALGDYELEPVNENGRYLRYDTSTSGEYYLIECRSNSGWDAYTGGSGLAIYHIDKSSNSAGSSDTYGVTFTAAQRWYYNEVNCRPDHMCAYMVNAYSDAVDISQAFYPYKDYDSFTYLTDPAFCSWSGKESPFAIIDITADGDNVCFSVVSSSDVEIPEVGSVSSDIYQDVAIISWTSDNPDFDGKAYVNWGQSDDELTEVEVESYDGGTSYAIRLEGLSARTSYKVNIQFGISGLLGTATTANFMTKSLYSGYPYIYLNNTERGDDGSFPEGSLLPLVVYNLSSASGVIWYLNGSEIEAGDNGYYTVSKSGELRAVITYSSGAVETISKKIVVK